MFAAFLRHFRFWGAAEAPLLRILKSEYPDGFGDEIKDYKSFVLKRGKDRRVTIELPNPRTLSKSLHYMPNGETR